MKKAKMILDCLKWYIDPNWLKQKPPDYEIVEESTTFVTEEMFEFIKANGQGKIASLPYYKTLPEDCIVVLNRQAGNIIGLSACRVKDKKCSNAIVVVHRDCRLKGIGYRTLNKVIDLVNARRINYQASVAYDNIKSLCLFLKCDKLQSSSVYFGYRNRMSKQGTFRLVKFEQKNKFNDN